MRILKIVHDYLPRHAAGAEIYAHSLSKELVAQGHQVIVFCTAHRPGFTQYKVKELEYDGIHLAELCNNHCLDTFEQTYDNRFVDEPFATVLANYKPDVVHIHSLMNHSLNLISQIKDAHIPIVHTVHDFWFQCEQGGKRFRPDAVRCDAIDPALCARCLATRPTILNRSTQLAYLMFSSFRWMSGINLAGPVGRLRRLFQRDPISVPLLDNGALTDAVIVRNRAMLDALRQVDRFLCPSAFLRNELVQFGINQNQTVVSGYGFDHSRFTECRRTPSDRVRFGFIGTPAPIKGVHLLLEAFRQVDSKLASLAIYGSQTMYPDYLKQLRTLAGHCPVTFKKAYPPDAVAEVFSEIDVLVVPSLWHENQPLSIQEAFLAGVPVITANLGGMAELVEDGVSGLLYTPGDAADLARRMQQLVAHPDQIITLGSGVPSVKSIEADAKAIGALYEELVSPSA